MIETGIFQGIFGFAVYLGSVLLGLRVARRTEPALLVILAAVLAPILALIVLLCAGQHVNVWAFAASYSFFSLCFLMVFGAVYKSVSLRILLQLSRKPGRNGRYDDVLAQFVAEESYQHRLTVIQEKQLAVRADGAFSLTERGRQLAQAAWRLQSFFGIKRSG